MKNMVDSFRSMRKKMLSLTSTRTIKLLLLTLIFLYGLIVTNVFLALVALIVILLEL